MDLTQTWALIRGALLDTQATWDSYYEENNGWQKTALLLTGPLIIGSALLEGVFGWIFGTLHSIGFGAGLVWWLRALIMSILGFTIFVFVINFLAGKFQGKPDFNRSFAALSLAAVPAYIGSVFSTLPWIGWLISLALSIYSLVLLYRILPKYLEIPDASRTTHYIVSLLVMFVASMILGAILGLGMMRGAGQGNPGFAPLTDSGGDSSSRDNATPSTGIFGSIEQSADYSKQAMSDQYEPPADGELSDEQVKTFIDFMQKTKALREEYSQNVSEISDKEKEQDLSSLMSAFSGVANIGMAEMKVVKTGGGNWAEHQWVRKQLDAARIQKDINPTIKHNYALYQRYQSQLDELM